MNDDQINSMMERALKMFLLNQLLLVINSHSFKHEDRLPVINEIIELRNELWPKEK